MRTLIKAAIRILIIVMTLQMLLSLVNSLVLLFSYPPIYGEFNAPYFWGNLATNIFSFLITILILFIVWRKTDWLVGLIAEEINDTELTINTNNVELITVVVRILGIVLLVTNLRLLVALIGNRWILGSIYPDVYIQTSVNDMRQWIAAIVGLLLGIWLVLGGKGIVIALDKIWSAQQAGKGNDAEK